MKLLLFGSFGSCRLVVKLTAEHTEQVVDGLGLKVGFLDKDFTVGFKHSLSGNQAEILERLDNPLVDFILELFLLYKSDAADEAISVYVGGRRMI